MADSRFYWIKLRTDFFADDSPMDILLGFPNGSEYVCLYLKLCLMTANKGGRLCNEYGEMIIPYNIEKIQQDMKFFSIDTVRVALELYKKLGLIYEEADGILKIADFDAMVGSEGASAKWMRDKRERDKAMLTSSITSTSQSDTEIRDKDIRDKENREEDKDTDIETIKSIVAYLNDRCGTHYQTTDATKRLIRARLKDFTEDDFYIVIDKMQNAWGNNPKMKQYLRPQTLFGTKFESYLNRPDDAVESGASGEIDWSKI